MWTSQNPFIDFVLWLFIGGISFWVMVNLYYVCFRLRGRAYVNRAAINALFSRGLLRLQLPPQIAYIIRGRLQGLRIQLSVLDREYQDPDNATQREVRDIPEVHPCPSIPSMSEEEINDLPVRKYKAVNLKRESTSEQGASSSSSSAQGSSMSWLKCPMCMDFFEDGDFVRTLPCMHQFHADCIDPWLKRQAMCPVCKVSNESIAAAEAAIIDPEDIV